MSQKLEKQVLQRKYTYDDDEYVLVLDLGQAGLECDLGYDRGHLHVTAFHPNRGPIGEFSVPIHKRIEGEPDFQHNNGVITFEANLVSEEQEDIVDDVYPEEEKSENAENAVEESEPEEEDMSVDEAVEEDVDENESSDSQNE